MPGGDGRGRMRIVVHDYSGHPFQVQLSRELARRGHEVLHLHFGGFQTPKGALVKRADDPASFQVEAIELDRPFAKYRLVRRLLQERELGRIIGGRIRAFSPDVVISANAPLDVQAGVYRAARSQGAAFIFWLQDFYSEAIARHLRRRLPGLGYLVALRFTALERRLLRKADRVVAITDDFRPLLQRWNVRPERVVTVENWAPLDDIAPRPKDNPWAREHGLHNRPVILYSGTLGLKHNPALLLEVAKLLQIEQPEARLVVVSEGLGSDWLRERGSDLPALIQLPFQPFDRLADVIGTADLVVAILDPGAGVFSVPSKVLTYLAAGRPVVGSIPEENLATRLIVGNGAGLVVSPIDPSALAAACIDFLARDDDRREMGRRARAYAESAFDIGRIADRFEAVMRAAGTASRQLHVQPAGLPDGTKGVTP
jgi:colanic acid biosynthesis glycosyl transferase WcaI